jgi:hypothetical protein
MNPTFWDITNPSPSTHTPQNTLSTTPIKATRPVGTGGGVVIAWWVEPPGTHKVLGTFSGHH